MSSAHCAFGLLQRVAAATHWVEGTGFHGAGFGSHGCAEPVSRADRGAEFLGDVVPALRGGNAIVSANAAAHESEGRNRGGGEYRRGRECLPAIPEAARRRPADRARSHTKDARALRN